MSTETQRTCPSCGQPVSRTLSFCPVCFLGDMLGGEEADSGAAPSEDRLEAPAGRPAPCFEHYQLLTAENGKPIELGRGAMGITYKAFDIELQCPVALKVISEKYLGDKSARLRLVREARAAASLRHPNIASVFHLGKSGGNYFYAMEFVEGETLGHLIKRRGRLEVKLALEIMNQVAVGLTAMHKKKLVHRDIKPSNIMVSFEEGDAVNAKIIDLGLAKSVLESGSQTAISVPGEFAGTPEYASPEQLAGVDVDVRSDLYSLGITLWQMLTGKTPFRGTVAQVMYQHLHAPPPIEQLKSIPQAVVVLLQPLLEKDPGRRFQTPAELLKAMTAITDGVDKGSKIMRQSLQKKRAPDSGCGPSARLGPQKISIARLPVTGKNVFGREEDIAFLDSAWTNAQVNVVTIVAWAGVGKSTLVNHWLRRRMAAEHYRSAQLVFGWSFYRQGTSEGTSSADEFLNAALSWFGDSDTRVGTSWEKGERLAKLVAHSRTLLVLDGLEPLQNPPGPQEGRLREPSLQALLRELAAFNTGLCVITTRTPVADIADYERSSALRRELEQLSSGAGAKVLRALDVEGDEEELRTASDEFSGHCLALTLLGSYLTDAYNGDIHFRKEVSARLAHDVRQGVHARKVMESYEHWFGGGPEVSVLRLSGLFDRPADEKALGALLKPPAIRNLTQSLTNLAPTGWRKILGKLRRARLLAGEDPQNRGTIDAHPLVREYFGEQLRSQQTDAWKECNRRLYHYYRTLAPELPNSFREMEPLFSAVICGCNAGLYREALHEVYIARIQRGNACFAAKVLGATGPLLSVLVHFFEDARWGSPVQTLIEGQSLDMKDQVFILMQAGLYLTTARGLASIEAQICYERAESLCHSLNDPRLLYMALIGQWRYSLITDKLTATMQIAERVYSLAQEQNDSAVMIGACRVLACTFYFLGDFETARRYAKRGVQIWRSGSIHSYPEEHFTPVVSCLLWGAMSEWDLGEIASCHAMMGEGISAAKELNDKNSLAIALNFAAQLAENEGNSAEVDRLASDLIELSTRHNFVYWGALGAIYRGWARSASGDTVKGVPWIEHGIRDYRATGAMLSLPYLLALKAKALYLADRTSEALEAISEAEALVESFEERRWCAELHRLSGVFLSAMGADETQIEASFCEAISIARKQKSVSLEKRTEATYAEYHRQKASGSGRRGFRLPLC